MKAAVLRELNTPLSIEEVVVDKPAPREGVTRQPADLFSEKKIQGSNRFRIDMPNYSDLYLQGRLELDQLLSQRLSLDAINQGFDALKGGEVARSVVVMDG